jgi:class 3 adenylate cyclase
MHHILIVDDNPDNCDMLARRLKRRGLESTIAVSGEKALGLIEQQKFDLVLLDIMMPGINGLQVLEKLRATFSVQELPVIMATAKIDSEDVVQALVLGANDYVTKPIDFPVLFARVQTQLELKDMHDHNRQLVKQLETRNTFIREAFGRYMSDDVVNTLLESPSHLQLGGELRNMTILFADLRGFTKVSENLEPDKVVSLVNNFFGVMTRVIDAYQGTINEFYGDGILTFFGAPLDQPDHARRAVACAIKMQESMRRVNALNDEAGLPMIQMGIGINTGDVVVGNVGSEIRAKYGVVGNPVNVAARIEKSTRSGEILVSDDVVKSAGGDASIDIPRSMKISIKGIDKPVTVHQVTGIDMNVDVDESMTRQHGNALT